MNPKIFTVSEVNNYIATIIEEDELLNFIGVEGEVTNWSIWKGNTAFFSLRDESSLLNCVMFGVPPELARDIADGVLVLAIGKIRLYHKRGVHQLYCSEIRILSKVGRLFQLYNELKERLKREGLFDKPKKPLPPYPKRIAVVTSRNGAALQDIIKTLNRRYPLVELRLYHTQVQGDSAKYEIVRALKLADQDDVDLILLARGGGSLEDLWAFNEEMVVRTVYELKHPVVTGVGHEVDFTLVDFVADRRAPTPTGAAELVTPDVSELLKNLDILKQRSLNAMIKRFGEKARHLDSLKKVLMAHHPGRYLQSTLDRLEHQRLRMVSAIKRIVEKREWTLKSHLMTLSTLDPSIRLEDYHKRLQEALKKINDLIIKKVTDMELKLDFLKDKLELVSPEAPLQRGYVMVKKGKHLVKSSSQVSVDDEITLKFWDGDVEAVVKDVSDRGTGTGV